MIHTAIRMAAYNTAMTLAREIRTNTGFKRANQEAQALMRQMFRESRNMYTAAPGHLTITLNLLLTKAKTAAPLSCVST